MTSSTKIILKQGDITKEEVDAIVNAANSSLCGGGGVDGAIHRAGGPLILEECREIVRRQGKCPPGHAVVTGGGNLSAKYVIHTVGPIWSGGSHSEPEILRRAYENCLALGTELGLDTIAFPSISTGAYGFPIEPAAKIALGACLSYLQQVPSFSEIRLVLFSSGDLNVYQQTLAALNSSTLA